MVKLSALKVDPEASRDGIWFDWVQGVRLKIARIGNPAFDARLRALMDEAQERGETANQDEVTKQAVAETVLVDWEGIDQDNGKPLKWSPKVSAELLSDEALADLYKFVVVKASETAHYRFKADKEALGN